MYIFNKFAQYFSLKTNLLQGLKLYIFCFILSFTSSSPCRKDQFAALWFSASEYYCTDHKWETRHHSTIYRCGLADIFFIFFCLTTYPVAWEKCRHFATPHFVKQSGGRGRKTPAYFLRLTLTGLALKQICGEKKLSKNCVRVFIDY